MIRALCCAALLLPAPVKAQDSGDATVGEAVFARACTRCHQSPVRLMYAAPADPNIWLNTVLASHRGIRSDADRANVIAYLLSLQ